VLQRLRFDRPIRRPTGAAVVRSLPTVAIVLALSTAAVALLESPAIGLTDASPVYFVAVVIAGSLIGTWPAIATAIGSFLIYDLLFTQPTFTVFVSNPQEWLDLVLFLVLAVIVGRLSALGRNRAEEASRRAAESTALFAISRILATELAGSGLDRPRPSRAASNRRRHRRPPAIARIVVRHVPRACTRRQPGPLGRVA